VDERRTLLCVHPHPDDESIACGGVLARAAATGARAVVVTCTGGEAGENLAGIDLGTEDLTTHRRREMADAIGALGVHEHLWLGYRDSGMVGTDDNEHPDSFHRADLDEAAARLAAIVRRVRPDVVVSDDEHGTYGHPDHVKAHRVTVRAVALAADEDADVPGEPWQVAKRYVHTLTKTRLWQAHEGLVAAGLPSPFGDTEVASVDDLPFGTPDDQLTTVVDVEPWLATKRAALLAHRSQIGPESFFLNTPDELASRVFGTEEFVLEEGTPSVGPAGLEDDLFAGLTAVGADPAFEAPGVIAAPNASRHGGHDHWGVTGRADDVSTRGHTSPIDVDRFRRVLGRFVTGVTVMTTLADGVPHAMTASSVASVSLDPPLVLVCVDRTAVMADHVRAGGVFALSMLADDQAELSITFADPSRPSGAAQFEGVATRTAETGAPLIDGAVGWVDTRVWQIYAGGDHLIVVGQVVDLGHEPDKLPLAYHAGGYGDLELRP
jgi:N-acetyl-1-D-myo-inositol-2-amino-2-deoxy-alpha-D-glucopyranoside deacetylase